MKKKLIALALIIIVALAAMEGLYLLLRRAHEARQTSPVFETATSEVSTSADSITTAGEIIDESRSDVPVAEFDKIDVQSMSAPVNELRAMEETNFSIKDEPTGLITFDDMTPEEQTARHESRQKTFDEIYAKRFDMSIKEWNALSPKEQRLLIRKGKR